MKEAQNVTQTEKLTHGFKKTDKKSQFQFGNLKNLGGGLNFSKMSEFQLFCNYFAIILQYYLYKKCLKIKNV